MNKEKLKKFFFKRNKKITFFGFLSAILGLLAPIHFASANWLGDLAMWIPTNMVMLVCWLLQYVAYFLLGLASGALNSVLSSDFISFSYTNPATNPIIKIGLSVTQGLVNMMLVLVLIFIALATILRLAGYETKKLLVTFIFVALLVNFSPVICGWIVDSSNILMNFFTQDLKNDVFVSNTKEKVDTIFGNYKVFGEGWEKSFSKAAAMLAIIGFCFILIFVLFILTCLFMFRYLVIWILVILSPLAFACYILPATKKYWELWWKQFLNWTFIGVTCGFFLYLSMKLVQLADASVIKVAPVLAFNEVLPLFINAILPSFVCVGFLVLGIVFGLATSAMGASTVINLAKRSQWKAVGAGKWVGKKAGGRIAKHIEDKTRIRSLAGWATKGIDKWAGKKGAHLYSPKSFLGYTGRMVRWAVPDKLRKYGEYKPAIDNFEKAINSESSIALTDGLLSGRFIGEEAAAVLSIIKQRGDGEDIMKAYARKHKIGTKGKAGYEPKTQDDYEKIFDKMRDDKILGRALDIAGRAGMRGKILRNEPRLARAGAKNKEEEFKNMKKLVGEEITPADIASQEKEVKEDLDYMEMILALGNETQIRAFEGRKGGVRHAQSSFNRAFSRWVTKNKRGDKDEQENLQEYVKYLKQIGGTAETEKLGFEKALENPRFRTAGWEELKYVSPEAPSAATGATAGATVGVSPRGAPGVGATELKPGEKTTPGGIILTPGAQFEVEKGKKRPLGRRGVGGDDKSKPPPGRKIT